MEKSAISPSSYTAGLGSMGLKLNYINILMKGQQIRFVHAGLD